ncbi:DNA gyrase subunit A [bacterium]|nr:DNA gyrase subunit A [bacterium]
MNSLSSERILPRGILEEMSDSYLDYSMSVIVQRALPDVRDGLKPVHRRILFGMNELNLGAGKSYKKCARVVGDVMGKYHPHGDSAIYDSLVRMAQDFAMRYMLIQGQGNFGSIDGDSAAAMRYTEARMQKITQELMTDIDKDTIDFVPNYDDSLQEPSVLPTRIPNLLANGSSGIAVGMATNIPPHNLGEIINGLIALIENPEIPIHDPDLEIDCLMRYIPGPDFPTGGIIYGLAGIRDAYTTGRGKVVIRARVVVETPKSKRDRIVVLEIPFQVDKSKLIERIAEKVNERKIEGIADIRDESDRDGMRLVIVLKRDAIAEVVLNNLYKHSQLQSTFGIILLALTDGIPKVFNLKEMLNHFIDFRLEVIERRTKFELRKAKEREHIFLGLKIAVDNLDEVIKIIRSSADTLTAKKALIERFDLSEIQAKEILDMRLSRLTGLERQKIIDELKVLKELIVELEDILAKREKRMAIVKDELQMMRDDYADVRRTDLISESADFTIEDMIAEEDMVISITRAGYIKRYPVSGYRSQKRGGKGKAGHNPKEEDVIRHLFVASTHNYLLFFTNNGQCYWLKVHEIPSLGRTARGKPIVNLIDIGPEEQIAAMVNVSKFDENKYVFFATKLGMIKKSPLSAFKHPRQRGIIAIKINEKDSLIEAGITDGNCKIVLGSSAGKAVHFRESEVRPMGRNAAGVKGINLGLGQILVGMVVLLREGTLLIATENGFGKKSDLHEYRLTRRGAQGVIAMRTTPKTGPMISIMEVVETDDIFIMTSSGIMIRQHVCDIRTIGRVTQGVRLIRLGAGDHISDIAPVVREESETEKPFDPEETDQKELFEPENSDG